MHNKNRLFDIQFSSPDIKYRIKPFWFWNGTMTETEIVTQLEEMKSKGVGGAFICARQGLTIPYLSNRWFELIRFTVKEAKRLGLEIWLYDEYPYPSGMAGGEVLLQHPEAVHQTLEYKEFPAEPGKTLTKPLGWTDIISAQAVPMNNKKEWLYDKAQDLSSYIGIIQVQELYQETGLTAYNHKRFFSYSPTHILTITLPDNINGAVVCKWKIELCGSKPLDDFKYYGSFFDPCDADAVGSFISLTHERYKKFLADDFKSVKGFYSDETGLLSEIPWSKQVVTAYEKKYMIPLKTDILALFDKGRPDSMKIRYQYYECIHTLFVKNYHKKIADWCRKQNTLYVTEVPSMRMTTQQYSDIIGGDCCHNKLGEPLEKIYDAYLCNFRANSKSITSLAKQLNKAYAMVESFHSLGWTMTLQDAKSMIDYMGIHGINFFVFHAFYYTIDGITKHDAPPSQFLQNPYWKYYKKLADYAARICVLNKETQSSVSIAVLDPTPSLWLDCSNPFQGFSQKGQTEEEKEQGASIKKSWQNICKTILFNQMDYDHLDGEVLKLATIKDGCIYIGQAVYRILVLTPATCMEEAAALKIREFLQQGGHVIAAGNQDYCTIEKENIKQLGTQIQRNLNYLPVEMEADQLKDTKKFIDMLQKYAQNPLQVKVSDGNADEVMVSIRYRKAKEDQTEEHSVMLFVVNHGKEAASFIIGTQKDKQIENIIQWNLENGEKKKIKPSGHWNLSGYESMLLEIQLYGINRLSKENEKEPDNESRNKPLCIDAGRKRTYHRDGMNVYRMSEYMMSLDRQNWQPVEVKPFIEQMANTNILPPNGYLFESDFGIPKKIKIKYPVTVYYRCSVRIEGKNSRYYLMHDRRAFCGTTNLMINNISVTLYKEKNVRLYDFNNCMSDITDYLQEGDNIIDIKMEICSDSDGLCDPLYILGDFSVDEHKNLITKQTFESPLDLPYVYGSPFYSGTITWEFKETIEDPQLYSKIVLSNYNGYDCVEIKINNIVQDIRCFAPYQFKLQPQSLIKGDNHIEIKITNTLANMLEGCYFDYTTHETCKIGSTV